MSAGVDYVWLFHSKLFSKIKFLSIFVFVVDWFNYWKTRKTRKTGKTSKRCEICSKLTIKTPERRQWRRSGVFINFNHISHLFSSVSIVDFEQVNVSWVTTIAPIILKPFNWLCTVNHLYMHIRSQYLLNLRRINSCLFKLLVSSLRISQSDGNLEKEISEWNGFSRKVSRPKIRIFRFSENFAIFDGRKLKWMTLQFSQVIDQNALVQSDCMIIWSPISLEGIK